MGNRILKILAIDDNQDNLITLKALINDAFPEAVTLTALNGTKGLELAGTEDPDLILLDIVMPGMDGFEVCKKLKTSNEICDIPVVFITALKGDKESRILALECGAEAFLAKPIDEYELTAQIRAMVKIKAASIEKRDEKARLTRLVEEQTNELQKTHCATLKLLENLKKEIEARKISETERIQAELEKRALERQFQQTQKLESLGILAGGIAHDFNNILSIILGHCFFADDVYISGMTDKEHLHKIEEAAHRGAELCRQMLAYAGKSPPVQTAVNLVLLVNEVVKMLTAAINKNVAIMLNLESDIPEICGDNAQIQQIVMNLIINSAEAIGDKEGTITIALTKTTFLEGHADTDFLDSKIPPGIYACLEVSDTGCGIDEETQKRIFEPFFTTKFAGRGLGMSAISGIIKSHSGTLQLTSTPGAGTTFKLYFPLPAVQVNAKAETADSLAPFDKTRGTILLVDDEEALRTIGSSLLNAMGFSTLSAANGIEALELYMVRRDEIDLVMLDLIMPKMGGTEAYHELRKTAPVVPIIICSGYGAEAVEDVIANDIHVRFVIKPYKPLELRDLMVEMITNQPT